MLRRVMMESTCPTATHRIQVVSLVENQGLEYNMKKVSKTVSYTRKNPLNNGYLDPYCEPCQERV